MSLKVEYAWQPPVCTHCCVFGHSFKSCNYRTLTEEEKLERVNLNVQKNVRVDVDPKLNDG